MNEDTEFYFQHDVIDRLKILLSKMKQDEKTIALHLALDTLISQELLDKTGLLDFSLIWEELKYPKSCYTAIKLIAESLEA